MSVEGRILLVQRVLEFGGGSIIIRRFNTVKKEVRKNVETSEKIQGYAAGEGEFENNGQEPLGPQKGPKNVMKKSIGDLC